MEWCNQKDWDAWQRHCQEVRSRNAAQALAQVRAVRVELAQFVFGLLAVALALVLWMNNIVQVPAVWQQETIESLADNTANGKIVSKSAQAYNAAASQEAVVIVTVKRGDTLWDLSGTNWPMVCRMNSLADCDLILIGQRLTLPAKIQE